MLLPLQGYNRSELFYIQTLTNICVITFVLFHSAANNDDFYNKHVNNNTQQ